ncbi:MAG: hypothetical protein DWB48_07605 [Nitrosomonas sp.]|nr:hypothetical protein [Nitrosomonas sp.]
MIANPPYVRMEFIKELKLDLQSAFEDVYSGRADLYVYFFRRGFDILKLQGVLTFITPNKFMRANYGEKLRSFLASKARLQTIIDFGDLPVFDATTYPMITIARNQPSDNNTIRVLEIKSMETIPTISQAVDHAYPLPQETLSGAAWLLSDPRTRTLMDKINGAGKPLGKHVNGAIYRGVVTGLNEAFIIDEAKRNELIADDPRSAEVIKPFIIGRDVKRWTISTRLRYIIFTYHRIDISRYPAIEHYLKTFRGGLEARATSANHKWYELQQPQMGIYPEFEKLKITWGNLATQPQFALAQAGVYVNAPANIIRASEDELLYLLAILNSTITQYFIASIGATRQGGFIEYKPMYVSQIPIAEGTPERRLLLQTFVKYILYIKSHIDTSSTAHARDAVMVSYFEQIINALVYELYFPEEIHGSGRNFMSLLQRETLPSIPEDTDETHIRVLRQLFERLFKTDHPLREAIFYLDSLELVRIIEGKA